VTLRISRNTVSRGPSKGGRIFLRNEQRAPIGANAGQKLEHERATLARVRDVMSDAGRSCAA
jgi:hypothetical protein